MNKILLNASNLHVGGGVQVATSVISELSSISSLPENLTIWASSVVDRNLRNLGCDLTRFPSYEVVNTYGLKLLYSPLARRMREFSVILTVFGPLYIWKYLGINITGFAQPWIIYPNNEIYQEMLCYERFINNLKFYVQTLFFKKSNNIIVELDHVAESLVCRGIIPRSSINVVPNCLSSVYITLSDYQPLKVADPTVTLKLGFVGRNYVHKNTKIFPKLTDILHQKYGINSRVYVTFTDAEWSECDANFRDSVSNVGPLLVSECPSFYKSMDAVIFPSLLECFSATPLEAMAMEKPLFVSDRAFNRDVCKDFAYYFDPTSPECAAKVIADFFSRGGARNEELQAAKMHAINFSSPKDRAIKYLDLLVDYQNNRNY